MELFAITGILALSLIFALLAASAALKLILFLMVRYNVADWLRTPSGGPRRRRCPANGSLIASDRIDAAIS
jgi:hypothetical protein